MRIALLTRRFDPEGGGTERDLMVSAECLVRAGHELTIYAEQVRGAAGRFSVRALRTLAPGRTIPLLRFGFLAPRLARREGAALVISFARAVGADVLRSGGGAHRSYLSAARQWRGALGGAAMWLRPYHQAQMLLERVGFGSARLGLVLAVSKLVADDLVRQFGLLRPRVVTLYNGVDLQRFTPLDDAGARDELRRELELPVSRPLAIFVGNGFARKGLGYLLQAWAGVDPGAYLLVVGRDHRAGFYRRLAAKAGVGGRVLFLGARRDVASLLRAADALVLPSLFEPFGNVVMEAMASGVPALTSARAGVAEILPPELSRLTVADPSDIAELSLQLNHLIEAAPRLREPARATAERFTWDRYAAQLLAALQSNG